VEVGGWYIPRRMGSGSCSGGTAIVPILFVVGRHATLVCHYSCSKTWVPLFWLVGGITLPPLPGIVHGGWALRLWWDEFPPVALPRYDLDMVLVFSDGVW
jgi:hypothetical protein